MKTIRIDTRNHISVLDIHAVSDLRELLGDTPEHVRPRRLPPPYCMFVADNGLLKALPLNAVGSWLYETDKHGSPIVGDVYLLKDGWGPNGFDSLGLEDEDISALLPWMQDAAQKVKGCPKDE